MKRRLATNRGAIALMVGGLALAVLLFPAGCSRSGAVSGDVVVRRASGEIIRGTRLSVYLVLSSEAFEREWAEAVMAFRQEVAPALAVQKTAEIQSQDARLAWDRALAARGRTGAQRGRWTLALRETAAAGSQERWRNLRATEGMVFESTKRVWEIVRKHEERAQILVEKHAAQRVQTDETGHFVVVKVPAGRAYLFGRLRDKKDDFVWFVPLEIQTGTQRVDLTQDNQRRWSFAP